MPPLRRRPPDVGEAVERVHPLEDDRLELGHRAAGPALPIEGVQHRAPEAPLHGGVDGGALLVDDGLDAAVQLLDAALDRHREQRQHFLQSREVGAVQIARVRRHQLEGADHPLLVVQRSADEVADAAPDQLLLHRRPVRIGREVLDDEGAALEHGPLVDGPRELRGGVVRGVGEDARLLVAGGVVQHEHAVALHRREPEAQTRPPEEGAQLGLQSLELRVRHDRVPVDEVPLERGEHLLIGDVHRLHDHEAAQHEALRGQEATQVVGVEAAGLQPLPRGLGQRRLGPRDLHVHETPVELQPEVPVQPGLEVGDGEDHRHVAPQVDAVDPLEDQLVGEQQPRPGQGLRDALGLQEAGAAAQRSVRAHQRAPERRRRVERPQLEREQRRAVLLLPEGGGEHRGHHQVHEAAMLVQHREILDDGGQLRSLARLLAHEAGDRPATELVVGRQLRPELDQRREAQLAPEGKGPVIRRGRRGDGGRTGHRAVRRRHARILPVPVAAVARGATI